MSWFSKAVQKTEAEAALELVKITGEAHVAAVVGAAKLAGKTLVSLEVAKVTAVQEGLAAALVARAQAAAQAAVAAATAAATPPVA